MLDNWTINYFIAVAIKQTLPSTLSLVQYANTMIGLMNIGSCPPGTPLINGAIFDEESWVDEDYVPLVDLVHQRIATHPLHQQ